jgi:lysophospholipase L1-like esterase
MSGPQTPPTDRDIALLGVLLLSVPTAGTLLLLVDLLLQPSAAPFLGAYSGRRLLALCAVAVLAIAEVACCRRLVLSEPVRMAGLARRVARAWGHPATAAIVTLVGVEGLLLLGGLVRLTHVTRGGAAFSLAVLAYVHAVAAFAGVLLLARSGLRALYARLRSAFAALGALTVAAAAALGLVSFTNRAVPQSLLGRAGGDAGRLASGNLRQGDPRAFWSEFERTQRSRWLPYAYFRTAPFDGRFHNVGPDGIRRTLPEPTPGAHPRVFVFGGSTVWGVGARDAETIPSHLSRLLRGSGRAVEVRNLGEGGYVSTQSLILFLRRLQLGDAPDVAVFYEGFNDVYSAVSSGYSGIPLYEANRARDFEMGQRRRERESRIASALVPLAFPMLWVGPGLPEAGETGPAATDLSLMAKSAAARDVVDLYLANLAAAQSLADAHGVKTVFAWQPHPYLGKPLTRFESEQARSFERYCPGLARALRDADSELRGRAAQGALPAAFLDLSRAFEGAPEPLYIDFCHLTEEGNARIAERLLPAVLERLPAEGSRGRGPALP